MTASSRLSVLPALLVLILVLAALVPGAARVAEADTLPSDQPGASSGWVAINEKQVQVEVAGLFTYDNTGRLYNLPVLGRIGVMDEELEVRVGISSAISVGENGGSTTSSGFNNPYIGAKWNFFNKEDLHLAVISELVIPVGPFPFGNGSWFFRPVMVLGWGFNKSAELVANIGFNFGNQSAIFFVIGVGVAASDDLAIGVNFAGDSGNLSNTNFTKSVDVTAGFALSGDLQFDLSLIKSLDDDEQFAIYAGVTIRIR